MPKNKNKQRLKNLIHAKKQASHHQKVEAWIKNRKPMHSQDEIFTELHYTGNVTPMILNNHYDPLVTDVIKQTKKLSPSEFNPRDNRTLFGQMDYYQKDPNDYPCFCGIVTAQKVVENDHHVKLYLLLSSVYAAVKHPKHQFVFKPVTDHLWIDVNDFSSRSVYDNKTLTVGLGDIIHFIAEIDTYRGYREGIKQTKYGVKNISVINAGYPVIKRNRHHEGAMINLSTSIPYHHGDHYLIRYHDPVKYPTSFPSFGDQIDPFIKKTVSDGAYKYLNKNVSNPYLTIKNGVNKPLTNKLVLTIDLKAQSADLDWFDEHAELNDNQTVIGTVNQLYDVGLETFYKEITDKYHWRYLTKNKDVDPALIVEPVKSKPLSLKALKSNKRKGRRR